MDPKRRTPDHEEEGNADKKRRATAWEQILDPATSRGADVKISRDFLTRIIANGCFDELSKEICWQREVIRMMGKTFTPKRETAAYGDEGTSYTYSGSKRRAAPWTPNLAFIRHEVENATGQTFNFVLCNLYRDGTASIGHHSDDESDLNPESCIASVSLGPGERDFALKPRKKYVDSGLLSTSLLLNSGSLLIMGGTTQTYFTHAVPKRAKVTQPRINLTFRNVKI